MVDKYKDEQWLKEQCEVCMRTFVDIARECGVNRKTVEYYAKKFGISTRKLNRNIDVEIECYQCGGKATKKAYYVNTHKNKGRDKFFCDKTCADKHHSEIMRGTNNPNFGGKYHGTHISSERRSAITKKQFERYRETGILDEIMKPVHEGHARFFSTPEGIAIRRKNGVITSKIISDGRRTSIEIAMASELTKRGIEYVEQYNLGDKFRLDFLLPEYGIVIECDGDYWHNLPEVKRRDIRKNAYIKACGHSLYRFWESEINESVEACVDIVIAEINEKEAIA